MRKWQIGLEDPSALLLAADARTSQVNPLDDQVWELKLGQAEPAAILLRSSYGLRASNVRLFPQFTENFKTVSDPKDFYETASMIEFFPNYLALLCCPFEGIEIKLEYWVPQSNAVSGRISVINNSNTDRQIQVDLVALLNPIHAKGAGFLPEKMDLVHVLQGKAEGLEPVIFITGGALGIHSPYPALRHDLRLPAKTSRQFTWVHAGLKNHRDSFREARNLAAKNWPVHYSKIRMLNSGRIEFETGNTDWDAALAFSQNLAHQLIVNNDEESNDLQFLLSRSPEKGSIQTSSPHSLKPPGALDTWYIAQSLIPINPQLVEKLLQNFLDSQQDTGRIPWKANLSIPSVQLQAFPILCSLCLELVEQTQNLTFARNALPKLRLFLEYWFSSVNDRDANGIPEWAHALQSDFEESELFSYYQDWSKGVDPRYVESPALAALLARECLSLIKLANLLQIPDSIEGIEDHYLSLKVMLQEVWHTRKKIFTYRDRESHLCQQGKILSTYRKSGRFQADLQFDLASRLHLELKFGQQNGIHFHAYLHGQDKNGQPLLKKIDASDVRWTADRGYCTLDPLFSRLEQIELHKLPSKGVCVLHLLDLRAIDLPLLLPLWSRSISPEQASSLSHTWLEKEKGFHQPYGMPANPKASRKKDAENQQAVRLPWNTLVLHGLIENGMRQEAAALFSNMMAGVLKTLKADHAFRESHHSQLDIRYGDAHHVQGLLPLKLFMDLLGVQIHSPTSVTIHNFNPFGWPIKLRSKGFSIECFPEKTIVQFPSQQVMVIEEPGLCHL